jgi:hypothetical protein
VLAWVYVEAFVEVYVKLMANRRSIRSSLARRWVIILGVVAAIGAIYHFRHVSSIGRQTASAATIDTLNVEKGTEKYLVEPGRDYVPVGANARFVRVESVDGYWFAVSRRDGTVYRDCAKEPIEIAIANNPETSLYRIKLCGAGRRLVMTGK